MSSLAQRSFASGELSPALHARTDVEQYATGVKTLRNFLVGRAGGARNRPGFIALAQYDNTTHIPRLLIPWDQSFYRPIVLELGERVDLGIGYIRFWTNGNVRGARMIAGLNATTWTTATPYAQGDVVFDGGSTYYYCFSAHTSGASTEPGVGASWDTVWHALENDANGDPIAEIPLLGAWASLFAASNDGWKLIQWADAAPQTRYFVHPLAPMFRLVDTVNSLAAEQYAEATFAAVTFTVTDNVAAPTGVSITGDAGSSAADDTRYFVTAIDGVFEGASSAIVQWSRRPAPFVSGIGGGYSPITVSWSAVSGAEGYNIYRSIGGQKFTLIDTVVGKLSYTDRGTPKGVAEYSAPDDAVRLATFADPDYPGIATAYQQRLMLSGVRSAPDTVYASRSASFTNFSVRNPVLDDDAVSWRQVGPRAITIRHMAELNGRLVIFTDAAEGVVTGDSDGILRPGEANPRNLTFNGSAESPRPLHINTALLYLQASGSSIRELTMAAEFRSRDLTELSAHLVDGYRIDSWCFQQSPDPIVWAVRSDGVLLSLTYAPDNGVMAWARHDTQGQGTPAFLSVAAVHSVEQYYGDTVYAIVSRANGTFIEMLAPRLGDQTDPDRFKVGAPLFLDCATAEADFLSVISAPAGLPCVVDGTGLQITGLDHLEGEEVAVVGFLIGAPDPKTPIPFVSAAATGGLRTVTAGAISITQEEYDAYGGDMIVGLPIVADLETLDIDTASGRSMKERGIAITRLGAWIEQSRSFFAGPDLPAANALTDMARITVTDADGIELTTTVGDGYVEGNLNGRFNKSGRLCIRHVEATPLTVLAVMPMGQIGG